MVCSVLSAAVCGVGGYLVTVEVDMAEGLPCIDVVGLPGTEVKESVERVRVALKNAGYKIPPKRFTVNLSPAGIRKGGAAFDLPIAIGILQCMGVLGLNNKTLLAGELGLDGSLRPVRGILPMVLAARERKLKQCIIPEKNQGEGENVKGIQTLGFAWISDVVKFLKEGAMPEGMKSSSEKIDAGTKEGHSFVDFSAIIGQPMAKRAAEIAAAGFHNMLMVGPPGSGKSMIAAAFPGILPDMSEKEKMDTSQIYSVAGLLDEKQSFITERPFQNPHHSITANALVGGGFSPKPGVISLANHGILFLDELPEFGRAKLDLLRQPLEEKQIRIVRNHYSCVFQSDFLFLAAMNPCPCGFYPDRNKCNCKESEVVRYRNRVSGPILDRIDLSVLVGKIKWEQIETDRKEESSAEIRKRVAETHQIQIERSGRFNSQLTNQEIQECCVISTKAKRLLKRTFEHSELSMRGLCRIKRLARTIADMDRKEIINEGHMGEAIMLNRGMERIRGME